MTWLPFAALCAVLWLAALAVIWITDAHERRALEVLALLDTEAADWDEPSRAEHDPRPKPAAPGSRQNPVDGRTHPCPTPGYRGHHAAVGAGAISSPYLCHGCSTWFVLPEEGADRAAPTLVSTPVSHIVTFWQPGSHDWTWADEYADLIGDPVTERVRERVNSEGIAFADDYAPVMLGSDGRVWDGHHRIVLAIEQRIPSLMVEVVTPPAGGAS